MRKSGKKADVLAAKSAKIKAAENSKMKVDTKARATKTEKDAKIYT